MRPMPEISQEALDEANKLLEFLTSRLNLDWEMILRETLSSTAAERSGVSELDRARAAVQNTLDRLGLERPAGAVVGGTGLAKTDAGLGGEESQRAVQILKMSDRLIQCGKGRGKALVVVTTVPVTLGELPMTADKRASILIDDDMVSKDNVVGMLKAVRDKWKQQDVEVKDLQKRNDELSREVMSLREQLEARDRELREMTDRMNVQVATSWS